MISNIDLVAFVRDKIGCGYVYGATGELITEAFIQYKASQYPEQYTSGYIQSSRKWIGYIAYDCSGLVRKATGTSTNANGYYLRATEKGKIATRPEIPGVLVFQARADGTMYHVGVYVGNNKVIEARGVNYGVVETEGRTWSHWAKCHAIDYGGIMTLLKIGFEGAEVKDLQTKLNQLGYGLTIDGDFGPKTESAVKDFQSKNGLTVDGIVGDKTWAAIEKAITPSTPTPDWQGQLNEKDATIAQLKEQIVSLTNQIADKDKLIANLTQINDTYYARLVHVANAVDTLWALNAEF